MKRGISDAIVFKSDKQVCVEEEFVFQPSQGAGTFVCLQSLSILVYSTILWLRVVHCKLGRLQKGIFTQSETLSAYLTSTSMESERVAACMRPLLQPVPLFLLQLHVEVSGAWGRSWTFTSNLLQEDYYLGQLLNFERSKHCGVCLTMSTLEGSGCTYCFGGYPIDFW